MWEDDTGFYFREFWPVVINSDLPLVPVSLKYRKFVRYNYPKFDFFKPFLYCAQNVFFNLHKDRYGGNLDKIQLCLNCAHFVPAMF
jgi:hypothetical protein